jgi:hypothetical protein
MSQKSSDPQAISFVSQPLKRDKEILALAGRPFQICGIDRHFRLIAVGRSSH